MTNLWALFGLFLMLSATKALPSAYTSIETSALNKVEVLDEVWEVKLLEPTSTTEPSPSDHHDWGYTESDGPGTPSWGGLCQSGTSQSPLDLIETARVTDWPPLQFVGYDYKIRDLEIFNSGHTVEVMIPQDGYRPRIREGGLPEEYELEQLHFHWGSERSPGSEHTLRRKQYPAEVHFVHYKTSCGTSLAAALSNCGGDPQVLAVIGVFIEVGARSEGFEPIAKMLELLKTPKSPRTLPSLNLSKLLPEKTTKFYRYSGSLTTPDCNEIVIWSVMKNPVEISEKQLTGFWEIMTESGQPLVNNFRPVQERNGRTIIFADLYSDCPRGRCHLP